MNLLTVNNVSLQGAEGFALHNISFKQNRLQRIAIAGETGSGKTSLLKVIAGLFQPTAGDVRFLDEHVEGPAEKLVPGHAQIAYLSQLFELPKSLRVEQVLSYANATTADYANTLYEICQIDHLLQRRTDQLSGGERQRIAIARLLSTAPQLLLLDEPFAHLDLEHKDTLKKVIANVGARLHITCILVSHDPNDTLPWADKIIVMKGGSIVQQGTPQKVYTQPVSTYAAGLLGHYCLLDDTQTMALGLKPKKHKKVMIRPEAVAMATRGRNAIAGTVQDVRYFGSHSELVITTTTNTMQVRTDATTFRKGDAVKLVLRGDPHWISI